MRRRALLLSFIFSTACFETGFEGDRLGDTDPPCEDCTPEPTCPAGERCAEDTLGLRFRAPRVRVCGSFEEMARAHFGSGPPPPVAVGGTMTLAFTGLMASDRAEGAIVATAVDAILSVRELSIEPMRSPAVVLEGVAAGSARVAIRRVEGDLLIDRTQVSVADVASLRVVAPGQFGCVRPEQVLYRPIEVAPVAELVASSGAILVDESAHLTTEDGEPLGPIAAGIDRVSLVVVAGGAATPIELDVVDGADAIERASAARDVLVDPSVPTELFRCFRAVSGDREIVGAAFQFEAEREGRRWSLDAMEGSPQCLSLGGAPADAVLHVRAAGAERVEHPR